MGSLINSKGKIAATKNVEALFNAIELIKGEHDRIDNTQVKRWYKTMYSIFVLSLLQIISTYFYPERSEYFIRIKNYYVFQLSSIGLPTSVCVKTMFANISIKLYCLIIHLKGKFI